MMKIDDYIMQGVFAFIAIFVLFIGGDKFADYFMGEIITECVEIEVEEKIEEMEPVVYDKEHMEVVYYICGDGDVGKISRADYNVLNVGDVVMMEKKTYVREGKVWKIEYKIEGDAAYE